MRNHLESRTLGVETSTYTFSADGRRVGMTRGATSLDVVLGLGGRRLCRVLNGTTRDYVWLGDTLIGYFDGTVTEPVRVLTSHIGFPLAAVDAAGTMVWEPLAEPYGELIGTFSKSADPGLRYPGQWQDEVDIEGNCVGDDCTMPGPLGGSVSLFENGFRWYRSAWGRYSQSDPVGGDNLLGSLDVPENLFAYAAGNPFQYIDPFGLCSCEDDCPSGDWNYHAISGSWNTFVLSGSLSRGTFTCEENGFEVPVKTACWQPGVIMAAGIGYERDLNRQVDFNACNEDQLLGVSHGVTASLLAWSFHGHAGGTTGGIFRSNGAGAAYSLCLTTRRTGWLLNPFGG